MYYHSISNMMSHLKFTQKLCPDGTWTKQSKGTMHILRNLFVWAFVLLIPTAVIAVGAESTPLDAGSEALAGSAEESIAEQEQVPLTGKLKYIGFEKDKSIREGLHVLAARFKKNIVPSSKVDGPLNVTSLYDVTFKQALEAILGNDFKYEQDGNFIKVYTAEEYKKIKEDPARMVHKVITLYYITAEEASKLIKPVLSSSAKIEETTSAQKSISAGGGDSSGGSMSTSGGGDDMALNDMIVIFDYPENIEKAEEIIRDVDTRPKQVLIEATIMSARLTEDARFGIDWNLLSGVAVSGFPVSISGGQGTYMETVGFADTSSPTLRAGFSADNVQALITAYEGVTDTTILANPKILTVNKQEGSLLIGRKIGYRGTSYLDPSGNEVTGDVKFLETGTRLVFRPYIGNDGYIRMVIYPKDSTGELDKTTGVPNETTTEVITNIIVKDGQTLIIGGLFRDSVNTTRTQVPLLGNLPLFGTLFSGAIDIAGREEVIILLTPHIIEEPEETGGEARADDVRRKRFAAKDSLQLIDRARLAEESYAQAVRSYIEGDNEAAMRSLFVALMIRPTYLEAIRLKERIIAEIDPESVEKLERIMLEDIDRQEAPNWMRR